jgi:glyoxylase-like metal-dependent hydrolase (beta-lactamase superfamily II)
MQVNERIYRLGGICRTAVGGANVYLLLDSKLTLVDTGFRGRTWHILRAVRRLGYSPSDVANIIITHHHADHVGSLAKLKRATGARVIAHSADAPYIDGSLPQPGPARPHWLSRAVAPLHRVWGATPTAVDIVVAEGDELPILGGIKVLHTPGHTPGSICLLLQQEGTVIVGDLLVNRFGLRLPSWLFTVDIGQEIRSIRSLAGIEFESICFGHGSPILRGAQPAVSAFAGKLETKYQRLL